MTISEFVIGFGICLIVIEICNGFDGTKSLIRGIKSIIKEIKE